MMKALTINGAKLMHQENFRGSIEVGKVADLVLLDRDPYQIPPEDISQITVIRTLFKGEAIHKIGE